MAGCGKRWRHGDGGYGKDGRARGIVGCGFVAFLGLYTFFDFREGGPGRDLSTTKLAQPGFYVETFGAACSVGAATLLGFAVCGVYHAPVVGSLDAAHGA